jgi:hypothetical protein
LEIRSAANTEFLFRGFAPNADVTVWKGITSAENAHRSDSEGNPIISSEIMVSDFYSEGRRKLDEIQAPASPRFVRTVNG